MNVTNITATDYDIIIDWNFTNDFINITNVSIDNCTNSEKNFDIIIPT